MDGRMDVMQGTGMEEGRKRGWDGLREEKRLGGRKKRGMDGWMEEVMDGKGIDEEMEEEGCALVT